MNHAEQAEKLLARYHDGQGSDQLAIAHALLAINDTLKSAAADLNIEMPPFDEIEANLADLMQRVNAALMLANRWEHSGSPELRSVAQELREVLR